MPMMRVAPDCEIHYLTDDFTDPWTKPETVMMLHGNAESSAAWFAWVPYFARKYKIVRPDIRGFGQSTPVPIDYQWDPDRVVADLIAVADGLGIGKFHLISAKVGGTLGLHFGATRSDRLLSLTAIGAPISGGSVISSGYSAEEFETKGVEHWARRTMAGRLGPMPPEAHDWWAKYMAKTPVATQVSLMKSLPNVDVESEVVNIKVPTLIVTSDFDPIGGVGNVRRWQEKIPGSELHVERSESFHPAATSADKLAVTVRKFIDKHSKAA